MPGFASVHNLLIDAHTVITNLDTEQGTIISKFSLNPGRARMLKSISEGLASNAIASSRTNASMGLGRPHKRYRE